MALCGRTKLATILSLIAVLIVANPRLGAVDTVSSNTQQALDAIAVSALVLDRNGLPVRNVQATDLMVREDGRPVSLTSFNVTRTVDDAAEGRAMVVYVIDPKGLDGRTTLSPDGLVAQTGGVQIENSNDFRTAVDRIWRETGNYYTLEYMPEERQRELHAIEVKALNPAWRVRARRSR